MFSHSFYNEIIDLAKRIAWNLRDERAALWADPSQPEILPVESEGGIKGLRVKFKGELDELRAAANFWDELPDIVYYAACLQERKGEAPVLAKFALVTVARECIDRGASWQEMEAATLAKYRRRAAGLPKDIEAEREAITTARARVGGSIEVAR